MPRAATEIFSKEFDAALARLSANAGALILEKIADLGRRLESHPHHRLQEGGAFRLRVGDYRVIYDFEIEKNEISLITVGHRREVYR